MAKSFVDTIVEAARGVDRRYQRFLAYLAGHPVDCEVGVRLWRAGVDLHRVFAMLIVYIEGRSVADDRKKSFKSFRAIVNVGVRKHDLSPDIGRWFINRAELATATNGLGLVHNVDSLVWVHTYLEMKTGRRVTMQELSYLIDATNHGLGREPLNGLGASTVDPKTIGRELQRHRVKNPRFLEILREDVSKNL